MTDPQAEKSSKKVRLSLDITSGQNARLDALRRMFDDEPSKIQVVRRAIKLLEIVAKHQDRGAVELEAVREDKTRELIPLESIELYPRRSSTESP